MAALTGACSHDWDPFDPRATGATGGAGPSTGTGGDGATGATATSSSGAQSGGGGDGGTSGSGGTGGVGAQGGGGSGGAGGSPLACTPNETQPCYTGPPGTENVGPCMGGMHTCLPDGTAFGPCMGQTLPASESCVTLADDDCDGVANDIGVEDCGTVADDDCNGTANDLCALWSKRFGQNGDQSAYSVAVDPLGNVMVVGETPGPMDFGGGLLSPAGGFDVFVVKLAPNGSHVWSALFGDATDQTAWGVATDGAGNVLITGFFEGTLDFGAPGGPIQSAGAYDAFVAKLDAAGNPLWAKAFGSAGDQRGLGIAADGAGNVVVVGEFAGTIDFGGGTLTSAAAHDGFITKLDPAGAHVSSFRFGGTGEDRAVAVAVAPNDDVLVTGSFDEEADFGGGVIDDGGSSALEAFVARLAPNGSHVWSAGYGKDNASFDQRGTSIAVDALGNAIVVGAFEGVVDFGGGSLSALGGEDIFVAKLGPGGAHVWSKAYGSTFREYAVGVAIGAAGSVSVAGILDGGVVDFGGGGLATNGPEDPVSVKLDAQGAHVWSRRFGTSSDQDWSAVATDAAGNSYFVGFFEGTIDLGNGVLSSAGAEDALVAKLAP